MYKYKNIKLLLPLSIILLILLIITTTLVSNQYSKKNSLEELKNIIILSTRISGLTHELQLERGLSSGFISKDGTQFKKSLLNQRKHTDIKIELLLKNQLVIKYKHLKSALDNALKTIKQLARIREEVNTKNITSQQAINFYSQINHKFFNVIVEISKISTVPTITQRIISYSNFLYMKENVGKEKAVGTAILSNGDQKREKKIDFIKLIAMQELYMQYFMDYATEDGRTFYKTTMQGKEIEIVQTIREKILYSTADETLNIHPEYWLENITIKIDKLQDVNDYFESELLVQIFDELKRSSELHKIFALLNIFCVIFFLTMMVKIVKLIQNERRLKALTDKYIISSRTDLKGNIIYASEAFCKTSGYTEDELLGKPHNIVRHPDTPKSTFNDLWKTIQSGKTWTGIIKNLKKNGEIYWVYANVVPLTNKEGKVESYVAIRLDITQSKLLEKQVQEEIEKNKSKDKQMLQQSRLAQMGEMISMIAHQWRQPLAAISSMSTGINLKTQLGNLTEQEILELSNKITEQSQYLSDTINDFRDFFRPNKEKRDTTFTKIINSVLSIVEASITTKDIAIIKELNCSDIFSTYPNEIKQVVLNLLKNAEDALTENKVENPTIKIATYTQDGNYILELSDNAGGVPKNIIDEIFNPYFSTKTKKDGTGLGLYMSKTIIEDHCNGELTVSNENDGAVFKIIIKA